MAKEYKDIQAEAVKNLCSKVSHCRMCKSPALVEYLDLGLTSPADQFRPTDRLDLPEVFYPLKVLVCQNCGLSQLSHVVDPRVLFQYDYPYESSTTKTGKKHWDSFASDVVKRLGLKVGDLVVDVGSNVGTLLESFRSLGMKVYGVDPAPNIAATAVTNGVPTICDFFSLASAEEIVQAAGKAKAIVGTNVFAHIDDLDEVMEVAEYLLDVDGVFIFESPYFKNLVNNLEYDTIYHEHLSYLSIKPLIPFFGRFGLEPFAVEESVIHGGSIRVYVGRKNLRPVDESVTRLLVEELKTELHDLETLKKFAARVQKNRNQLISLIENLIRQNKTIVAVSAPAKGMTLIHYCGLTNRHLKYISEKSPLKIGRFAPGGHAGGYIPVVEDDRLIKDRPDYALLLAWNFASEIMSNLKEFSDQGGKFIIPIPEPKIV